MESARAAPPRRAPLGTARSRRAIVPSTHLAREGAYDSHHRTAGVAGRTAFYKHFKGLGGYLAIVGGVAYVTVEVALSPAHPVVATQHGTMANPGAISPFAADALLRVGIDGRGGSVTDAASTYYG